MQIDLLAIGTRMPAWVDAGVANYQHRLPRHIRFTIKSINAASRKQSGSAAKVRAVEAERLLKAVPPNAHTIALDERGESWSSRDLANKMEFWLANYSHVALLVGGADGLDDSCKQQVATTWSLSPLTLPHALVRVLVSEQLYRGWTLLQGHPYHRD